MRRRMRPSDARTGVVTQYRVSIKDGSVAAASEHRHMSSTATPPSTAQYAARITARPTARLPGGP